MEKPREFDAGDKVRVKTIPQLLNSIPPEIAKDYNASGSINVRPTFVDSMKDACGVEFVIDTYTFDGDPNCSFIYRLVGRREVFGDWMLIKA